MKKIVIVAAVLFAPGVAYAADFSGDWSIDFKVGENPGHVDCTMMQSGNTLSGHCLPKIPNAQPSDLSGMVDGSSAKWSYDVVFNGNTNHVSYEADMASPTSISGNLMLGTMPTAFTGTKQ